MTDKTPFQVALESVEHQPGVSELTARIVMLHQMLHCLDADAAAGVVAMLARGWHGLTVVH